MHGQVSTYAWKYHWFYITQNFISSEYSLYRQILGQRNILHLAFILRIIEFSIKDFFSKYDQIRRKMRIWPHLLKKKPYWKTSFFVQWFILWRMKLFHADFKYMSCEIKYTFNIFNLKASHNLFFCSRFIRRICLVLSLNFKFPKIYYPLYLGLCQAPCF